jgi:hypothetical protein
MQGPRGDECGVDRRNAKAKRTVYIWYKDRVHDSREIGVIQICCSPPAQKLMHYVRADSKVMYRRVIDGFVPASAPVRVQEYTYITSPGKK